MNKTLAIILGDAVANLIIGNPHEFPDAIDVTDVDPRPGRGWRFVDGQFLPPTEIEPPSAPTLRRITRLAFDNRFTPAELVAIEIASLDSAAASIEQRKQAAAVRVSRRKVDNAEFIDLDRPDTRSGVQQLEAVGLLAAGRAAEILDAAVQPDEVARA